MNKPDPHPKWLRNITRKRGGEMLTLLVHLVNVGLCRGHVTAEDAHCIPVSSPNCRGAAMKYLRRFGFVKDSPGTATTPQGHGHALWLWRLSDRRLAEDMLRRLQGQAYRVEDDGQRRLAI